MSVPCAKRERPLWVSPQNETKDLPPLRVFNSLTNEKDLFRPREGNKVQWYGCGPTVYDVSHMGHARTYISIDIIRRIMMNYLHFDVNYVMNITDIDDKIIKRARQNHLLDQYMSGTLGPLAGSVKEDLGKVLQYCEARVNKETDPDMKVFLEKEKSEVELVIKKKDLKGDISQESLTDIKDALASWLDSELGHSVTENSIFEKLPRHFENMFHEDMSRLHILPPDQLTRVSEYIPQIVAFIETIMERGFAYETDGISKSVYFDTDAFARSDKHYYAKLVPTAYGNEALLQEGEGALTSSAGTGISEKKSKSDFALWKASKRGEPSWPSPWGPGRPGWHIECSAMAGDKCGSTLDIHTGGVDLKFPHHDNELAQSEAHYGCGQWVNYFLHTGHLNIDGCKMSKSLKNFVSIKDALSRHSWRQLRLAFLLSSWKDPMDYNEDLMKAALASEKMLLDFFFNIRYIKMMTTSLDRGDPRSNPGDIPSGPGCPWLKDVLAKAQDEFRDAIYDSFDTRLCMDVIRRLIDETNKHVLGDNSSSLDIGTLDEVAKYIYDMMVMFGAAEEGPAYDLVQYDDDTLRNMYRNIETVCHKFQENLRKSCKGDHLQEQEIDTLLTSFKVPSSEKIEEGYSARDTLDLTLQRLGLLRQKVRASSRTHKWGSLLKMCDELRDIDLKAEGVRLEDKPGDMTAIGLYPTWANITEDKKKKGLVSGALEKNKKKTGGVEKVGPHVDPRVMFSLGPHQGLYSLYDEDGLPTHTIDGSEVSKNRRSKMKKDQLTQKEKFQAYSAGAPK